MSILDSRHVHQDEINAESTASQPNPTALPPYPRNREYYVKSVADDYLTCRQVRPDLSSGESSVDVIIARPWDIQLTPQVGVNKLGDATTRTKTDSQTITVAKSGFTTETWKLNPPYLLPSGAFKGSIITAEAIEKNVAGIVGPGGKKIFLQECSGRAWAQVIS